MTTDQTILVRAQEVIMQISHNPHKDEILMLLLEQFLDDNYRVQQD